MTAMMGSAAQPRHGRNWPGRPIAGGDNSLSGLGGNDYLKGLGGKDTLNGGDGSDLLDGGTGNDKLNGDSGIDLVAYSAASTKVVVDLSLATDTAKRGSETDTLTSIEGAIGSSAGDTFKGDGSSTTSSRAGSARTRSPAAAAATSTTSTPWPRAASGRPSAT